MVRRTEAVAVRMIEEAGLVPEVTAGPGPLRRGLVVRTEPAGEQEVDPGSRVQVEVSEGRAKR